MNRKTFLSSLIALIIAPFLGKSKENGISLKGEPINGVITDSDRKWVKSNPAMLYKEEWVIGEGNCLTIYRDDGDGFKLVNKIPRPLPPITLKGEDLIMVLNRKR